ncbi:mycofactocin system transcriptional regulator [uncultured Jatrophihabitans sp.]|uniref:mycofactocin system transcriptional regulator n=1 Tax=uncultured Jatrophihabitans sp. TaxID=1610747 RepID=UPI0035CAD316
MSSAAESSATASRAAGRARSTTPSQLSHVALELFFEHGFAATTIDDIAAAAGIGRRTLFRYFPSKNDLPWGDFDALLDTMRATLAAAPRSTPAAQAVRDAVLDFNRVPEEELPYHRARMRLLLGEPALVAHSTLRYQAWREVIAEFAATRLGVPTDSLLPRAMSRICLALSISAYEEWLARDDARLDGLLSEAFELLGGLFADDAPD